MAKKKTGQLDQQWGRFRQEINQDFKLHVGALVEDFDGKVKVIAEQHLTTMQVLQNITKEIKAIEQRIMATEVKLVGMDTKLDRIGVNLNRKVDYEEFEGLVKRVASLEIRIARKT